MRTLLIIVVLILVWLIVRHLWRRSQKTQGHSQKPVQEMLRCAHCGTFVPKDQAIIRHGQSWCSQAHSQAGQKKS